MRRKNGPSKTLPASTEPVVTEQGDLLQGLDLNLNLNLDWLFACAPTASDNLTLDAPQRSETMAPIDTFESLSPSSQQKNKGLLQKKKNKVDWTPADEDELKKIKQQKNNIASSKYRKKKAEEVSELKDMLRQQKPYDESLDVPSKDQYQEMTESYEPRRQDLLSQQKNGVALTQDAKDELEKINKQRRNISSLKYKKKKAEELAELKKIISQQKPYDESLDVSSNDQYREMTESDESRWIDLSLKKRNKTGWTQANQDELEEIKRQRKSIRSSIYRKKKAEEVTKLKKIIHQQKLYDEGLDVSLNDQEQQMTESSELRWKQLSLKKRNKTGLTQDEKDELDGITQERIRERKERNRVSAAKSRARQKELIITLKEKLSELKGEKPQQPQTTDDLQSLSLEFHTSIQQSPVNSDHTNIHTFFLSAGRKQQKTTVPVKRKQCDESPDTSSDHDDDEDYQKTIQELAVSLKDA